MRAALNYRQYIKSDAWKAKRQAAIERAGGKCQLCGKSGVRLTVHHNSYNNLGNEPPEDLIVLCWPCHDSHHQKTDQITARDVKRSLSRKARQTLRRAGVLQDNGVPLTTSEQRRRAARAGNFIGRLRRG
jgi:5-methylcytosine-specific restriction endonuclease McrA